MKIENFFDQMGASAEFGAPEFGYFKAKVQRHSGYKRRESYYITGEPIQVTLEEFDREYGPSHKLDMERFMGRANPFEYWRYERKIIKGKEGWIGKLEEWIKQLKSSAPIP